jgi:hypothetical protein
MNVGGLHNLGRIISSHLQREKSVAAPKKNTPQANDISKSTSNGDGNALDRVLQQGIVRIDRLAPSKAPDTLRSITERFNRLEKQAHDTKLSSRPRMVKALGAVFDVNPLYHLVENDPSPEAIQTFKQAVDNYMETLKMELNFKTQWERLNGLSRVYDQISDPDVKKSAQAALQAVKDADPDKNGVKQNLTIEDIQTFAAAVSSFKETLGVGQAVPKASPVDIGKLQQEVHQPPVTAREKFGEDTSPQIMFMKVCQEVDLALAGTDTKSQLKALNDLASFIQGTPSLTLKNLGEVKALASKASKLTNWVGGQTDVTQAAAHLKKCANTVILEKMGALYGEVVTVDQLEAKHIVGQVPGATVLKAPAEITLDSRQQHIMGEIFSTETTYFKGLGVLETQLQHIKKNLSNTPSGKNSQFAKDVDTFLNSVSTIKSISQNLINLAEQVKGSSVLDQTQLKDLTEWMTQLGSVQNSFAYSQYSAGYIKFLDQVKKLPSFEAINSAVKAETKNLDFSSVLIMPVQRQPRYALLFADMVKSTTEKLPDSEERGIRAGHEETHALFSGAEANVKASALAMNAFIGFSEVLTQQ